MENITNQILELDDGSKYFVLRQAVYKGVTYFLGAEVTPDEEDFTNEFVFLERVGDEDLMVRKVTDPAIIEILDQNIKIN